MSHAPVPMDKTLLFVYGTLKSMSKTSLGRLERERLKKESYVLGTATVPGELIDLCDYPGFVITAATNKYVHGEVLVLKDLNQTFGWLDAYECVSCKVGENGEYSREYLTAKMDSGEVVRAWVYVFLGSRSGRNVISSGSWTPHIIGTT